MAYKNRFRPKGERGKPAKAHRRAAPILKKRAEQLEARKKREDVNQAAARIVREATRE